MKKALFTMFVLAVVIGIVPMAYADEVASSADEAGSPLAVQSGSLTTQATEYIDYVLGAEAYVGKPESYTMFRFSLNERSHVYAEVESSGAKELSIYDFAENCISAESNSKHSHNSTGTANTIEHSKDLDPGTYYLRVYRSNYSPFTLMITAEPVVTLDRPSIASLECPAPNTLAVSTSAVADAMSYEYQYGTSTDFSDAKTVVHPATTLRATELAGDKYYYVRVRPFTVYNDGLSVYGNWSRVQAVYVEPTPNTVEITTKSKALKYASLKKKSQSFLVIADDVAGADLTYKLSPVSSRAKRYVSINGSTGAVTVKKGLAKGTYKMTVKVSAKAVGLYGAATASRKLTLTVK